MFGLNIQSLGENFNLFEFPVKEIGVNLLARLLLLVYLRAISYRELEKYKS